ncbi:hypothetical protein Tco_1206677, partial [Tanacetum coccineum]
AIEVIAFDFMPACDSQGNYGTKDVRFKEVRFYMSASYEYPEFKNCKKKLRQEFTIFKKAADCTS